MLLREWAARKYPGVKLHEQLRLGPTSNSLVGVQVSPALEAALRVQNWYADGLIVLPVEVLIIESKMAPSPSAAGQVLFYVRLARSTPALQAEVSKPFVPVVLAAEFDSAVAQFQNQLGCRVETYTPTWIADYLQSVQFRRRSTVEPAAAVVSETL